MNNTKTGNKILSSISILLTTLIVLLTNGEYRLNITTINGAGTGIWKSNTTMFKTGK